MPPLTSSDPAQEPAGPVQRTREARTRGEPLVEGKRLPVRIQPLAPEMGLSSTRKTLVGTDLERDAIDSSSNKFWHDRGP